MRLRPSAWLLVLSSLVPGASFAECDRDSYAGRDSSDARFSDGFIRVERLETGWIARPFNHGRFPLLPSGVDRLWLDGRSDQELHVSDPEGALKRAGLGLSGTWN